MRRILVIVFILLIIILARDLSAERKGTIRLSGETEIEAGQPWQLVIESETQSAGLIVQADMYNGLMHHEAQLVLGTGGIASWVFTEGEINQIGTSLVIVRLGDVENTFSLQVHPSRIASLQSFTTSNSITAYGNGETNLISFVADEYGNPIDQAKLTLQLTAPSGEQQTHHMLTNDGLIVQPFQSIGSVGLLRLNLSDGRVSDMRSIVQQPGEPSMIRFAINPDCILEDGLDYLRLSAEVLDQEYQPVVDGTVIHFSWETGEGAAIIVDGLANLSIPPFSIAGTYRFFARSADVLVSANLEVRKDKCDE